MKFVFVLGVFLFVIAGLINLISGTVFDGRRWDPSTDVVDDTQANICDMDVPDFEEKCREQCDKLGKVYGCRRSNGRVWACMCFRKRVEE